MKVDNKVWSKWQGQIAKLKSMDMKKIRSKIEIFFKA